MLVYFRKENSIKLDGLIAFIKLRDKLILKGGGGNITIPRYLVSEIPGQIPRYLLDARNAAALLGKYTSNILEIFRRLSPFGTSIL